MIRTRSEVKRALSICASTTSECTTAKCPYRCEKNCCYIALSRDALELMMELEAEVRALKAGTSDRGVPTAACELPRNWIKKEVIP